MNVRRSAAVVTAAVTVIGLAAPAAVADSSPAPSASPSLPPGLHGSTDPRYDGVWRQSLALLAQHTVGVRPAAEAVDWLTGQQCADGSFPAFRADPGKACDARTAVDTNSTAAAVQALAALGGHDAATGKAVSWLKSVQNKDGGWGYTPGGPSDANSTSVVIGALAAVGEKPESVVKNGRSPYDALMGFALPCSGDGGGAFAYQPDKKGELTANADATAAAVVAALGQGLAAEGGSGKSAAGAPRCVDAGKGDGPDPARAAANGASYLARAVAENGHLVSSLPGAGDQPDYGNTADAVVALAVQGGAAQAQKPLKWLERNFEEWAEQSGPAAYAQLVFAAHAAGADPRDFGGVDLVERLNATGPAPRAADGKQAEKTARSTAKSEDSAQSSGSGLRWAVAGGVLLAAAAGIGLVLRGRGNKRREQQS
ncbi:MULTISPECIES: prenyltransferase/squalene oxidase repeat-containing protein [Streptomyces]|uniref:Terpene cyclase/mutase family protein n=1 Tax=Streptomyces thermogriseus TaxID=75292 RepID=A0ABN1SZV4_9ACTN|nr:MULTISPECIES: prenyltransferase/squalene oxidase repeat-containing protein [Streptomyces]MDN5383035.1 terpene cyclase/mutase family protein [Streptomyces sp. LB8]